MQRAGVLSAVCDAVLADYSAPDCLVARWHRAVLENNAQSLDTARWWSKQRADTTQHAGDLLSAAGP